MSLGRFYLNQERISLGHIADFEIKGKKTFCYLKFFHSLPQWREKISHPEIGILNPVFKRDGFRKGYFKVELTEKFWKWTEGNIERMIKYCKEF